jgi:hypothetical protein
MSRFKLLHATEKLALSPSSSKILVERLASRLPTCCCLQMPSLCAQQPFAGFRHVLGLGTPLSPWFGAPLLMLALPAWL